MWLILALAPLQIFVGDMHGLNTLEHQPAKLAAMEGHWETNHDEGMPLYLFGIPDMQAEETKYAIGIPKLGSLILTHSMDGKVTGLKILRLKIDPIHWSCSGVSGSWSGWVC
jgi:Cytochrome bd-type quinol oxidase, subunit 1